MYDIDLFGDNMPNLAKNHICTTYKLKMNHKDLALML